MSQEEEALLVEHLKAMAMVGYGYTRTEVTQMASEYAVSINKRDPEHPFSLKWFRNFMKRWPELSVSKPRSLSIARAKATSQEAVSTYFESLNKILTKYDLKNKPENIYNIDEKGIQTEHSPPYVVGTKDSSVPAVTSPRSALTTIIGCGNALGVQIPPYFVFKGKRMRQELLAGCTEGAAGTVSDSGWSNSEIFKTYLESHFLKYVQRGDKDQHILVLYDGHRSHISLSLINWAHQHNIVLFVLPAHTSHVLQPLDLGCFGPFQRIYNAECHKFIRQNPSSTVTKYNVCLLACKAYTHALSPANLQASFKKSGIYPYDKSAVDTAQFAPAVVLNNVDHQNPESPSEQPEQQTVSTEASVQHFFLTKTLNIAGKLHHSTMSRRNISSVVSGKSITEEDTVQKLQSYQAEGQKRKPKSVQSSTLKPIKRKKTQERNTNTNAPGPSGLQVIPVSDSDSLSDESIADDEKCCVCHEYQPEALRLCVSLVFTKWAKCDFQDCTHWTHLKFCCKETVVRLHDKFICPCHREE